MYVFKCVLWSVQALLSLGSDGHVYVVPRYYIILASTRHFVRVEFVSVWMPFFSPREGISKNPLLVLPNTPQRTHMPNYSSLRPVVSAVRCLSRSHSVTEEFYILIELMIILKFSPARIPNNDPHPGTPTGLQHLALPGVAHAVPPPHGPCYHHHRHHRQPAASAHSVAHISLNSHHYTAIVSEAHCRTFVVGIQAAGQVVRILEQ